MEILGIGETVCPFWKIRQIGSGVEFGLNRYSAEPTKYFNVLHILGMDFAVLRPSKHECTCESWAFCFSFTKIVMDV